MSADNVSLACVLVERLPKMHATFETAELPQAPRKAPKRQVKKVTFGRVAGKSAASVDLSRDGVVARKFREAITTHRKTKLVCIDLGRHGNAACFRSLPDFGALQELMVLQVFGVAPVAGHVKRCDTFEFRAIVHVSHNSDVATSRLTRACLRLR